MDCIYIAPLSKALQFMPLIHPFTHTFTHQRRLAAMQGTNQLVRSNWGLGVLLRDTSARPGWDRTGNPPTARRQLLPPEPHRPTYIFIYIYICWHALVVCIHACHANEAPWNMKGGERKREGERKRAALFPCFGAAGASRRPVSAGNPLLPAAVFPRRPRIV